MNMARLPNCFSCKEFSLIKCSCSVYEETIPQEIYLEHVPCQYYSKEPIEQDEDLPIAKGR